MHTALPQHPSTRQTDAGEVLHRDTARDLTYRWHEQSTAPSDLRDLADGWTTSMLIVTDPDGTVCGYLRLTGTNRAATRRAFASPLAWASRHLGWCLGFRTDPDGTTHTPTPADLWTSAHQHARVTPKSGARTPPADPHVLAADLAALNRRLTRPMNR